MKTPIITKIRGTIIKMDEPSIDSAAVRLSLYIPNLDTGGAQRVILNLADGFESKGCDVDIVVNKRGGRFCSKVPDGVSLTTLDADGSLPIVSEGRELADYLRGYEPDVLFSALSHANIPALLANKRVRNVDTRIVVSNHCPSKFYYRKHAKARVTRRLVSLTYRWADNIITVSKGAAEDLYRVAGIPRERIQPVYNPVVTDELRDRAQEEVTHDWLPGDEPVVLAMGGMEGHRSRQKNFDLLVDAFAQVRTEQTAKLVILGKGEDRNRLQQRTEELGIADDVDFPGFVDNPFPYMRESSVFVLPSRYEGFGNVIVEAMACGCPVVSTDCLSGPAEILDYGTYGELVPVEDAQSMANAISETLENPREADVLQNRASEFSLENQIDNWEDAIVGSLGGSPNTQ